MTLLQTLLERARGASRAGALAGGALMLAAAVLVSVDVLLRKLFSVTLGGADELSGYALAIGAAWSFAFVLFERGNVRIDALYQHLPRPATLVCDLAALLALLVFVGVVGWHGAGVVTQSFSNGSRSNSELAVPLALPQALWWIGYAWFVLCAGLLLLRCVLLLLAGQGSAVNALIGARSIQEEAQDELAQAQAQLSGAAAAASTAASTDPRR